MLHHLAKERILHYTPSTHSRVMECTGHWASQAKKTDGPCIPVSSVPPRTDGCIYVVAILGMTGLSTHRTMIK